MRKVVIIRGAVLGDTSFTTQRSIIGAEITWNVTRIQRDANAGKFGAPEAVPMRMMPPLTGEAAANVDWTKVRAMIAAHRDRPAASPLVIPVLQVMVQLPVYLLRLPVDGNHRILARRELGMPYFASYVVPAELEADYRITEEIVDG